MTWEGLVLRRLLVAACAMLAVIAAYLLLAPVAIEPVEWSAPSDAGYVGPYASNTRLAGLHEIALNGHSGPEHVAVGPEGKLYAAVDGGQILRMNVDGTSIERWASTGGRVLGFDFDQRGRLVAADAMRGLLAIEGSDGEARGRNVIVLADNVGTGGTRDPIRYANAVVVAGDGKIYVTDSSRRFRPQDWGGTFEASVADIFEHSATGRVLVYDPATSRTETVASGLSFANGIALSADQSSIFVAETGEYRIWRFAVSARNFDVRKIDSRTDDRARIVVANLPGHPDNLMRGTNGRIWVGLVSPRSPAVDAMAGHPLLRKIAWRLKPIFPLPRPYGHVLAFDEAGNVVADLQDPAGRYPDTTGVTETADRLYIQSLRSSVLGWLPVGRYRNRGRQWVSMVSNSSWQ